MSITAQSLSSAANPLLKQIRRAVARGGAMPGGGWIAESVHLLEEALRSGVGIRAVICSEPAWPALRERFEGPSPPPVIAPRPGRGKNGAAVRGLPRAAPGASSRPSQGRNR